ncbi:MULTISPECIES: hypothetical protein [Burkholderia]|uniref:hypothetical protein n=1 Tax=Burkholderia TaxID=32008 RepID=UPI0011609AA4|nr:MULTISPECIES: hypothetical protein [Burkholderia]
MSSYVESPATVIKAVFQGLSSPGSVSVQGLQVGDAIIKIIPNGFELGFEEVVSVAGQVQQTTLLDWSSVQFTFYLLRGV